MNVTELLAARQSGGRAYAAAVDNLKSALIELVAPERALQNGHVAAYVADTPKFLGGEWHNLSTRFAHCEFVSSDLGNWVDAVRNRADAILAKFTSAA
jgi:hypothetical protein